MAKHYRQTDPLAEINRSQREEIEKYKWLESEKAGTDIGWERARQEWLDKHFAEWKRRAWQCAVTEAVTTASAWN